MGWGLEGPTGAQPDHGQGTLDNSLALPDDKVHVGHSHHGAYNADRTALKLACTQKLMLLPPC